jgi:hypothetical protein
MNETKDAAFWQAEQKKRHNSDTLPIGFPGQLLDWNIYECLMILQFKGKKNVVRNAFEEIASPLRHSDILLVRVWLQLNPETQDLLQQAAKLLRTKPDENA